MEELERKEKMKAQKLARRLRIVAQFGTTSGITRYFTLKAADMLEKQQDKIEEITETIQPVRCGECARRPVCILWDIKTKNHECMNYYDFCSKGVRRH